MFPRQQLERGAARQNQIPSTVAKISGHGNRGRNPLSAALGALSPSHDCQTRRGARRPAANRYE
jgi:hypothetical protein